MSTNFGLQIFLYNLYAFTDEYSNICSYGQQTRGKQCFTSVQSVITSSLKTCRFWGHGGSIIYYGSTFILIGEQAAFEVEAIVANELHSLKDSGLHSNVRTEYFGGYDVRKLV